MAIYRCEIKTISRKQGRNAILAACYRAGVALIDACDFFTKEQRRHDYTRRGGVVASGIILPDDAPASLQDRQALWNAQERAENRKNSRVAREAVVSLPHELTDEQRHKAVIRYARHIMERYGVGCDYAIHRPDKDADDRNHHAHFLFTTRRITSDGFGEKTRELDDKITGAEEITHMRQAWERICNDALLEAEQAARVDCRSLKAQGINRLPEPKQGAMATAMERRGRVSHAGTERRAVKAYNDALAMLEGEATTDTADSIPVPSQAVAEARTALRHIRRTNQRPAHWLYRQARYYLRVLVHRKRGIQRERRLSAIWRHVRLMEMVQAVDASAPEYQEVTTDTEPICDIG